MEKNKTGNGKRTSFILYHSQREVLKYLSVEEKASLLQAIFDFEVTGECEEPLGSAAVAFAMIREQLRRDGAAYEAMCEANSRRAKLRWAAQKGETFESEENPPEKSDAKAETAPKRSKESKKEKKPADAGACGRMPTDTDTYTDTDTDTESDTDTDTYTDTEECADSGASPSGALSRRGREVPRSAQEDIAAKGEQLFWTFWNAYPRKVHLDRARQAWRALVGSSVERASAVMRALAQAMREDFRFLDGHIPYPSNWLRNETPWRSDWAPPPNALGEGRSPPNGGGSFDTDEFFARALARSYAAGQR